MPARRARAHHSRSPLFQFALEISPEQHLEVLPLAEREECCRLSIRQPGATISTLFAPIGPRRSCPMSLVANSSLKRQVIPQHDAHPWIRKTRSGGVFSVGYAGAVAPMSAQPTQRFGTGEMLRLLVELRERIDQAIMLLNHDQTPHSIASKPVASAQRDELSEEIEGHLDDAQREYRDAAWGLIMKSWRRLTEKERLILHLHYRRGKGVSEIVEYAARTGDRRIPRSRSAVYSLLDRAKRRCDGLDRNWRPRNEQD